MEIDYQWREASSTRASPSVDLVYRRASGFPIPRGALVGGERIKFFV
jgi:hypothetical protein